MDRPATAATTSHYRDASSHVSPLRYPGGKRKLSNFIRLLLRHNDLLDGDYVEPYAGGASVALSLLFGEYVRRIHINDLDPGVHAFWIAARDHTDALCKLVRDTPLTMDEWRRQRAIACDQDADVISRGFATFFMNRTNRSGIITGGPIGGYEQAGTWDIGARFTRRDLVARIEKVGRHASRIRVYGQDAADLLRTLVRTLPSRTLVYLDPPYFVKGRELLYANYYEPKDHAEVAAVVRALSVAWVVSYDDVQEIRDLYPDLPRRAYDIGYSAHERYRGREVMFFSPHLAIPDISDPARLSVRMLSRLESSISLAF